MVDEEGSERKPADDEREVQLTRPKHGQTAIGAFSATHTPRIRTDAHLVGRGNRPARLHKRADTRLLGLINEMQPAEMPSRKPWPAAAKIT